VALGELGPDGIVVYERLLPAVPDSVPRIRRELGAVLARCALDAARRFDVELFVTEAAANAVRHAYPDEPGPLLALAGVDDAWLGVVISDWGLWPASDAGASAAASKPAGAGLGLSLMNRLADAVRIDSDGSGTDVEGSFALAGGARSSDRPVDAPGARGQVLREYLRVLRATNDELREDTDAAIAEARQAVAHSRRRRLARRRSR
jgi:anti-sigma regulatory factor (Ser/Thr protein kinase)